MTMSRLLTRQGAHTRLLAASVKSASDVTEALMAGAHDVTASPEVIKSLLRDPLSDQAFAQFAADWKAFEDAAANGADERKISFYVAVTLSMSQAEPPYCESVRV